MKSIKKHLKDTHAYTLVEVLLALSIFSIGIVPIYQIIINGAKLQNLAEETYEATLYSQALLQEVKGQIEIDVEEAYKESRKGKSLPFGKPWLNGGSTDTSLIKFLAIEPGSIDKEFNEKYNLDNYLYEVHIWDMDGRDPLDDRISFKGNNAISFIAYKDSVVLAPMFTKENTYDFTHIVIEPEIEKYFLNYDSLVWSSLGNTKPIAIGEITHKAPEGLEVKAMGIQGDNVTIKDIIGCDFLSNDIKLTYKLPTASNSSTHELIVERTGLAHLVGVVQLSIDLTTFPEDVSSKIIRIENRTEATIVIPIYNEKNIAGIEIYPIQENENGRIVVEERAKLAPLRNFVVGIVVRDANNITFGEDNKVLSKIVDVYSFDYNKQKKKWEVVNK